jgi:prepilin-type N-terminal cleavage/methylation domain-containing protein
LGMRRRMETRNRPATCNLQPATRGFTLLELLVVIAIIGLLTTLALPHLKGITRSNIMASANQQLLDDLALARQRAISGRSIVSVVFMPAVDPNQSLYSFLSATQQNQILPQQYTAYTLFAERTVGDQPGRPNKRYLTTWKTLPDGVFIATNKFLIVPYYKFTNASGQVLEVDRFDYKEFPYPSGDSQQTLSLPYISFDQQGRLLAGSSPLGNCVIPLARGGIFLDRDPGTGALSWTPATPRESGGNNSQDPNTYDEIIIDAVTGRAVVDRRSL